MPIRSDRRGNLIKRSQYKKKKYPYSLKCDGGRAYGNEEIYGTTDDPRRTLTSIWKVYRFCRKSVCVDFGKKNSTKQLCITEDDNRDVTYIYNKEKITKEQFKQIIDEH